MKKQFSLISRVAAVAIVGGSLSLSSAAFAQAAEETGPSPERVGSMAATGQKPRKSEAKASTSASPAATQGSTTANAANSAGSTGTGGLSGTDRQFLMDAAKGGMREVHMGQMAVQQGQSADVKKLGNMIVTDHTKANNQLMEIAGKRGVKPDTRHNMAKMSKKDMANFDQAWIGMMVNDHQRDIAMYQREAQQGADPELKAFAKKTLPVLQKHLKGVMAAQKKMGSSMTAPPNPQAATAKPGH